MNQSSRLLLVTSLNQLLIGIAQFRNTASSKDYLAITNFEVPDSETESIKNYALQLHQFEKIYDFRPKAKELFDWFWKAPQSKLFFGQTPFLRQLRQEVGSHLDPVDRISVRFGLNLPEHFFLNLFPEAKIDFMEDGIVDYMRRYPSFWDPLKVKIKKGLARFSPHPFYSHILAEGGYEERISSGMKLLQGDHSILPSYLGVLNDLRKTFQARPFERPFVFLLHKPYSQSSTIRATADQEIQFYDRLLKKVRERWPDLQIVFKVHPKSSAFLVKRLKELCEWPSDFERLPGELFAQDPNAKIVLGGISTTSIYSSVLFGKEAYYVSPDFVEDTPKVQSEKEAAKRFNVNYFPVD